MFLYEFFHQATGGLFSIFNGFVEGIKQFFNFNVYYNILSEYKNDFSMPEWILVGLTILFMLVLYGLIIFLIVFAIKRYLKFRKPSLDKKELMDEVAKLNEKVVKLSKEKDEILQMKVSQLGLKPDEKDKLSKFKEAYDNTLSEAEKQAKNLENLNSEVNLLKGQIAEKDAIISALSQLTGKNSNDVDKYVKMAKGLVDENTNIEQALAQVLSFAKVEEKTVPKGKPLNEPSTPQIEDNPFKTGNLTEQGKIIKSDREKAREMYMAVYGKAPSW